MTKTYTLFFLLIPSFIFSSLKNESDDVKKPYNAPPKMADDRNVFNSEAFVEYLFFRSYNSGLAYAFNRKVIETPGAFSNRVVGTEMVNPDQTWRPGFRLGYQQDVAGGWAIDTSWSYYYNKSVTNRSNDNILLNSSNENDQEGYIPYFAIGAEDIADPGAPFHFICQDIHTRTEVC